MQFRHILWASVAQEITLVLADAKFDFTKMPGGGPAALRECARFAYNPDSRAGGIYSLGCQLISCVCRADLIEKAHDFITKAVIANCGEDATVDVTEAVNLYNDYCSANGYSIPGYTYIITSVVQVSTEHPTTTRAPVPAPAPSPPTSDPFTTSANTIITNIVTVDAFPSTTATVTYPTIATVTVAVSSGSKPQTWRGFRMLYCVLIMPMKYIYAVAETLIVTSTASAPEPAVSLVVTSYTTIQTVPAISTKFVYATPTLERTTGVTFLTKTVQNSGPSSASSSEVRSVNPSPSSIDNSGSGGSNQGLTKLEVVGIIIGIVLGFITAIATVWMCVRSGRASRVLASV